jgi:hypothetical protein
MEHLQLPDTAGDKTGVVIKPWHRLPDFLAHFYFQNTF